MTSTYKTLRWQGDFGGDLLLTDQTLLPAECREIRCADVETVHEAIRVLRVRGAPAIGVAAAYGVVIGTRFCRDVDRTVFDARLRDVVEFLASSRPTAVNLFWALGRMTGVLQAHPELAAGPVHDLLFAEAVAIEQEDREMCRQIGRHGRALVSSGMSVLTHCNAGGLATAGDGTALSVIFAAAAEGKLLHVFADETRPLLQGARLTAWELQQRNIPVTVICDSMAAQVMKERRVQAVITGADRIAANGDAANKIGTYGLAILARHHGIPFYVAAPSSTFDLNIADGEGIPIEQRDPDEILCGFGRRTVPEGVPVYNPAFDVTPAGLISALITEHGLIEAPSAERIRSLLQRGQLRAR